MRREVPARARELAARLSALFRCDVEIVARLSDAQRRLLGANDRLWSGLHPDALGVVYDGAGRVAGRGESTLAGRMTGEPGVGGGEDLLESMELAVLQQTHWAIRHAFCEYQSACEERRQLAFDVGELAVQLNEVLTGAGWSEEAARRADVHELAMAAAQ